MASLKDNWVPGRLDASICMHPISMTSFTCNSALPCLNVSKQVIFLLLLVVEFDFVLQLREFHTASFPPDWFYPQMHTLPCPCPGSVVLALESVPEPSSSLFHVHLFVSGESL